MSSIKQSAFEKLNALKNQLDPTGTAVFMEEERDVVYNEFEQDDIKRLLLEQHKQLQEQSEENLDILDDLGGPIQDEAVEIEYYDGVVKAVVNISFETFTGTLSDAGYTDVRDLLRQFARATNQAARTNALQAIESYGEDAIEIILRECRQFDLVSEAAMKEMVQLVGRLAYRSLKGRLMTKGILEHSTSYSHLRLAIATAGVLRDREMVHSIERHIHDKELYLICLEALFKIRDISSLPIMIDAINKVDPTRKDLIDASIQLSQHFAKFGPNAIKTVFNAYADCENRAVRPVYIKGFRSFGENAVPSLAQSINEERDANRFMQICMTLGGLKTLSAVTVLTDALQTSDEFRKKAVIRGLGYAGEPASMDTILEELELTDVNPIKSECINALSYIGYKDKRMMDAVRVYTKSQDTFLRLTAMGCLVRSGEEKWFDEMMKVLLSGDASDRQLAETVVARLPVPILARSAQKLLTVSDDNALQIITLLQRVHTLSKDVGHILVEKLKQDLPQYLEIEIYRLIAKHVNTKSELLPASVLYDAKESAKSERLERELASLIRGMKNHRGEIVARD
ncbi:HEAT repeat domain-containing protein [Solibacillus sp. FSL H8-0538]|uniref:HEAT repeat domain-containing protein n=1 Tax=Solibacillus sp. FSL H8-0538 TaxID=2921400 RepID=UPI0030F98029